MPFLDRCPIFVSGASGVVWDMLRRRQVRGSRYGRTVRSRGMVLLALLVVAGLVGVGVWFGLHRGTTTSASTSSTTTTSTSVPSNRSSAGGAVRAEGTQFVSATGQVVQLTGVNVQGMEVSNAQGTSIPGICNDGWRPLTVAEVGQIASYPFVNTVRLLISWQNLEPTAPTVLASGSIIHHWNTTYVDALDTEINQLGAAHLHVILNMFQSSWSPAFTTGSASKKAGCPGTGMPIWLNPDASSETYQQASCNFYSGRTEPGVPGTAWSDFAAAETYVDAQYVDDPTVIGQDVVNEPYCSRSSADLEGFYGYVAPLIHQANPNIMIILEDREQPASFELHSLPPVANVVLSIHLHQDYWSQPSAGQVPLPVSGAAVLMANEARAKQWDVPLYVGEFYGFDSVGNQNGNNQPDGNFVQDTASFLTYAQGNGVGWTYWSWIQKKNPAKQPDLPASVVNALVGG